MSEATATTISFPEPRDLLNGFLRDGAQRLLAQAVEAEVAEWIDARAGVGATADGKKELIAMTDGHRESAESWQELLLDVKRRGLALGLKLAVEDGPLGFWQALREVFTDTAEQRCWVHETANALDKLRNPIESTFATIRLRHRRTKESGNRTASLTMMYKLTDSAA